MRFIKSPLVQFLALSVLLIAGITATSSVLAGRAAEAEAIAEARGINEVLARSVAKPSIDTELAEGSRGAADRFDQQVRKRLFVGEVRRVNIWNADGLVLYSSEFSLIGQTFGLSEDQRDVLASGGTGSAIADPESPENQAAPTDQADPAQEELVRIYTRLRVDGGETLLFEGYYSLSEIEDRRAEIYGSFRWITLSGPLMLVLLVTPMLWVLTGRLTSAAKERERLLHSALDASDAERRRIARDLHDSVVQDLAGTAFSVSAVARDPATTGEARTRLADAGGSLRDSLKALRSLLVEIHPPELQADDLAGALGDLIAPAGTSGVQASVSVEGAEGAPDAVTALVWRVAQEAVRNALRHSQASTLAVTVRGDGRRITLEVVDDGVGFDPLSRPDEGSFGLRGLRSLVAEAGGTLEVRSSPGEGTTVRMEVGV